MFSVQYIPLSVRVRSWYLSLFSSEELESFLQEDAETIMAKVAGKEKHYSLDTSSTRKFIDSSTEAQIEYLRVATMISSGATKSFLKELFHEYEIENLKNVVRMLISGSFKDVFYRHEFTPSLTINRMLEIRSFHEFSQLLEGTPYFIFRDVLDQVEQEKNALYWELALENYYVGRIIKSSKYMDVDSKKVIKELLLIPIHHNRIVALYRYRFHYNVEPADALRYVPNLTHAISYEEWTKFAMAPTVDEFYRHLIDLNYIPTGIENYASALRLEFNRQLQTKCKRLARKELTSISSFLAFSQLKKIQFQKLGTILESKTLAVNHSDILPFL